MSNTAERLKAIRSLSPAPASELASRDIRDLKHGGAVEFENETWQVKNVFRYLDVKWSDFKRRKKDYWVTELELFSLDTGKTIFVEWEFDDELEVCRTDKSIKLREITFQGNTIRREDLDYIADEEEGEVVYNGKRYHYNEDDTWAGLFYKDNDDSDDLGNKDGTPVRVYEFESNDGDFLSIEMWHEDGDDRPEREAFTSHVVKPSQFKLIQLKAAA